jgi:hypothetical protein
MFIGERGSMRTLIFGSKRTYYYHCFITMHVLKVLIVIVYEGTTQVVECFDRLLTS